MNSPGLPRRRAVKPASTPQERMDSEEFIQLLRRNMWLMLVVVLLVMGGTYAYLSRVTPMYRAEAGMALTTSEVRISQVDTELEVFDLTRARVETELDRLRSRNFAERVAKSLDLFSDPTFLPVSEGGPAVDSPARGRAVIDKVLASYTLQRSGESFVITVVAESSSPDMAAAIANSVVKAFIAMSTEAQSEGIEKSIEYLQSQIDRMGEDLTLAQMELATFIRENVLDDMELPDRLRRERTHISSVIDVMNQRNEGNTAERQRLEADLAEVEEQLSERTLSELRLARLELGVELMNTRYQTAVERLNILEPQRDQVQPDARQITTAEVPTEPFRPNIPTTLALALPGGLILGFILALLRSTMNRQIWNGPQATHVSQLPNLGNLPRIPRRGLFRNHRPTWFVNRYPRSEYSEAMRALLTVWSSQDTRDKAPRVAMITSALPNEGKSTVATSMAAIASQDGMEVLLLDFDTQRAGATRYVSGNVNAHSLSDMNDGRITLDQAAVAAGEDGNFDVISFDQKTMLTPRVVSDFEKNVLPKMIRKYDMILIDTPPALGVADAARLGTLTDNTLIVVRSGKTPERALRNCAERLEDSGVKIAGTVINDIEARRFRQTNLGGSYGYY
ncbi:Chromosome partitioning ATPase, Mrp family, contains Fe-S cluster [Paracoccus isoporae]|uniref:Chromosome partitioning ATPase, Mrp family, contains Fe-S cluster n=1 Tax=Paracoccus isoporae TaxID=591205 RepID=A0A1G6UAS0_9RHOB|nr:AAA family ATPase [Paracoccus isoporae]SDD38334.1 Chromosome partitioning ATPase, Mrp family, contains Fe-S cluster [Paracoccus isoporae]